ncbi:Uncharacterised protein [Mycobacteroides abscessus subsp. abscessus]|nr:Uncharacterised protein [Mycobacteroides abscessus subsp. abscessus]
MTTTATPARRAATTSAVMSGWVLPEPVAASTIPDARCATAAAMIPAATPGYNA